MLNKYFRYPFAIAGDKTAVPDPTQGSGAVSWQQGYGPQYELPYSDANARDVERAQNNQLHYDITTAVQEYQTNGTPDWIDPSQNGAANYAYPLGARVRYTDGVIYESIVAANNTIPTDVTKWVAVGGANVSIAFTNANVTASAAQAAQQVIIATGVLSANVALILPARQQQWLIVNNTTGAFTFTVRTAAGTGTVVPSGQTGFMWGDGTDILSAGSGRFLRRRIITGTGVNTPTPGTRFSIATIVAGGGGGGGGAVNPVGQWSAGAGGGGGGYSTRLVTFAQSNGVTVTIGAGGAGGVVVNPGTAGGASSFGALFSATGGSGGAVGGSSTSTKPEGAGPGGVGSGGDINFQGGHGSYALYGPNPTSGRGGGSYGGDGAPWVTGGYVSGNNATSYGGGGSGGAGQASTAGTTGGSGFQGVCVVDDYA